MGRPRLERNGIGAEQETKGDIFVDSEVKTLTQETKPEIPSPDSTAKAPVKQVVFRSIDRELVLYYKAGYTDKSHGISSYTPSVGVKFDDHYVRLDDTPENAKTIAWMRKHPNSDISFKEVPDMSNIVELPPIAELRTMTIHELKGLCSKNAVKHEEDASKDSLILALIEDK